MKQFSYFHSKLYEKFFIFSCFIFTFTNELEWTKNITIIRHIPFLVRQIIFIIPMLNTIQSDNQGIFTE